MVGALISAPTAASNTTEPESCGHPVATHVHKSKDFKRVAQRAWAEKNWRDKDPRTQKAKRTMRHRRQCARNRATRERMERIVRQERRSFRDYRREQLRLRRSDCIAGVTVYSYGSQCTAIPGYIVGCESQGDWGAYNPSGAAGIYQIMPEHGRPFPIYSVEDKRDHHRIAHRLWAGGSGSGNWVCA